MNQYQDLKTNSQKKLTIIAVFFVALLFAANLLVSNILATTGEQLKLLQNRKENLENQNNRLRQQIVNLSTLELIEEKAIKLGMVPVEDTLNLKDKPPVAMKQP